MPLSLIRLIFLFAILAAASGAALAQAADGGPLFPRQGDEKDSPMGFREMLKKMEIEKQKKEFEEMQDRGKQAVELSNELERSIASHDRFSEGDKAKLDTLEKLVKRIRRDLGGSDDDQMDGGDNTEEAEQKPANLVDGFKSLQSYTVKLVDELQKTSRFTVSTAAIRSSNSVLRLTKYLKFWK
jgi:hypothetical protein